MPATPLVSILSSQLLRKQKTSSTRRSTSQMSLNKT